MDIRPRKRRFGFVALPWMVLVSFPMVLAACSSGSTPAAGDEGTSAMTSATYTNAVYDFDFPDPSVVRADDGSYYAYGTGWLIPIVRSTNLVDWTPAGHALQMRPDWKETGDTWAPDIARHPDNGKYYLYYSLSTWGDPNPGIGVATADDPQGPFTDHGKLFDSDGIGVANSIDPMLFRDDDGKAYLYWGSFNGIYGIELSADWLGTAGSKFQIAGHLYEGAYVIKRGEYYYFFGSRGTCCEGEDSTYQVDAGRSASAAGPFVNKDGASLIVAAGAPVLQGHAAPDSEGRRWVGTGHNAIATDDAGTDWMLYHAVDVRQPTSNGWTRRPLLMDRIVWQDGWPEVEGGQPSRSDTSGPTVSGGSE